MGSSCRPIIQVGDTRLASTAATINPRRIHFPQLQMRPVRVPSLMENRRRANEVALAMRGCRRGLAVESQLQLQLRTTVVLRPRPDSPPTAGASGCTFYYNTITRNVNIQEFHAYVFCSVMHFEGDRSSTMFVLRPGRCTQRYSQLVLVL